MKVLLIKLFIFLSISCSPQSEFDLSEIRMPFSSEKILKKGFDVKKVANFFASESINEYTSYDQRLFSFDKFTFKKDASDNYYSLTKVYFLADSTNQIPLLRFTTHDGSNEKELYDLILKKFGKPYYYYKDKNFFNSLWELDNTIYTFSQNYTTKIGEQNTVSTEITIVNKNETELLDRFLSPSFGYYFDYINYCNKEQKKISYLDFAKEQSVKMFEEDKYLKEINENLPL